MITKDKNTEMIKLVDVINDAAKTYKEEVSSTKLNDDVEYFFKTLAQHHQVFVKTASVKRTASNGIPFKNRLKLDAAFSKKSAIDLLLLCIDIEKQILDQAREAVHNSDGTEKQMLCKQLAFSEKAIFEADQMLEEYE